MLNASYSILLDPIQCAALLHDIGPLSFSHVVEDVFKELHWSIEPGKSFNHEDLAKMQLKLLKDTIEKIFPGTEGPNFYQLVLWMIDGYSGITWIDSILNSPLDADLISLVRQKSLSLI